MADLNRTSPLITFQPSTQIRELPLMLIAIWFWPTGRNNAKCQDISGTPPDPSGSIRHPEPCSPAPLPLQRATSGTLPTPPRGPTRPPDAVAPSRSPRQERRRRWQRHLPSPDLRIGILSLSPPCGVPTNDLWIATLAIQHHLVFGTNAAHFHHPPQLPLCNDRRDG